MLPSALVQVDLDNLEQKIAKAQEEHDLLKQNIEKAKKKERGEYEIDAQELESLRHAEKTLSDLRQARSAAYDRFNLLYKSETEEMAKSLELVDTDYPHIDLVDQLVRMRIMRGLEASEGRSYRRLGSSAQPIHSDELMYLLTKGSKGTDLEFIELPPRAGPSKQLYEKGWSMSLRDLAVHATAMANQSHGGTIIFGADSMGTVVGVPEPADSFPLLLSKSIEKWVDGKLEIYLSPHKIEGKNVLALDVPPTDHLKAVNGNVYMRTGTAINEMKPLEVAARQRELLQVWSLQRAGDAKSVEGAKVKQYVDIEKVEHLLGSRPVSFASLLMQLQRLKLADRDEVFTLAGMLTVAVDGRPGMAWQDDFPQVSHSFVRMTRCDDVESWDDLTHEMKTLKRDFKGTAMQQVEGCLEWLLENASKGIDPGAALEMLINAIMHRDYDQAQNTECLVASNGKVVQWRVPGRLMPTVSVENIGKASYPRNTILARTLQRMGVGVTESRFSVLELQGRGILTARKRMEDLGGSIKYRMVNETLLEVTMTAGQARGQKTKQEKIEEASMRISEELETEESAGKSETYQESSNE